MPIPPTAVCRAWQCVPIDVRDEGVSDCQDPSDCHLRAGVGCCESCAGTESELVAVSDTMLLSDLVCSDNASPCLPCAPTYPPEYTATCDGGRCQLILVP